LANIRGEKALVAATAVPAFLRKSRRFIPTSRNQVVFGVNRFAVYLAAA
jgi:hypothetical protein